MIPNTNLQIGRDRFSKIAWEIMEEKLEDSPHENIENIISSQSRLRAGANYNTGSLSHDDAYDLYTIISYFKPRVVAEVGTFIGVSTSVIYDASKGKAEIHTCDHSNDIKLDIPNVVQYPLTSSLQMFERLKIKGITPDLVYLDGRLTKNDVAEISTEKYSDTVFVLDDFEGTEKGVANALLLERSNTTLIYPRNGNKTAILIPYSRIEFVRQEMT
jgi:hypothetical protein